MRKLREYEAKRDFDQTEEPKPKLISSKLGTPLFVIQKHRASHLHYDFRLEAEGVLKSWAIPKGPSMNPDDKRLAMMVEDHPFEYRDFEGNIPKGNYGAGAVMIWDEGNYFVIPATNKKENDKYMAEGLKSGHIHLLLNGKKIKGEFTLVRSKGMGDNAWLLIKKKDDYSSKKTVTKLDRSIRTERTIEEIAKEDEE